jgi:pimeloyl-ACP methyl ester carboxylesterase
VEGPFGQIHLRATSATPGRAPIVCLHATAYSSQSFLPLMEVLGTHRQVIAIDVPGYGDSDPPPPAMGLSEYAMAVAAALDQLGAEQAVLLGYHTGAYLAAELAILRPDLVERLVLIGVPYFQALDLQEWRRRLLVKHRLGGRLEQFEERWRYFITERHPGVTLVRGFANFIDELKAWPNGWWAHQAMFDYDSDARLPLVRQPVLVLNPPGHLNPASVAAARLMPDARLVELPDVDGPVLEVAPDRVAQGILTWLDRVPA